MVDVWRQEPIEETVRHLESLFEEVAHQYEPGELALPLRDLAADLIRSGYPREVVQGSLDDYRYLLRKTGREAYEDDVFDVVDFITGWCSPHMKILAAQVPQEELEEAVPNDRGEHVDDAGETPSVVDGRIKEVRTTGGRLVVTLVDGPTFAVPLDLYPRLINASAEQRRDWHLIGNGESVHWPQIDEQISAASLLRGGWASTTSSQDPLEDYRDLTTGGADYPPGATRLLNVG